ncbi:hypothetical protein [uncultured Microbacterium sp.]|uniref:hypothetical protein n=1 Tax=uncultured Microbacterium sp. TaxID=191216 RepID=UPI0025E07DAE|nr:hypothetical protein [uncultured Microbacterium sp.]
MVTVDTGSAARSRRLTWTIGGVLLVLSALTGLAGQSTLPSLNAATLPLFGLGATVLAIGIGRPGSVTARRPLGTGAILALVIVLVVVRPLLTHALLPSPVEAIRSVGPFPSLAVADLVLTVVELSCAIVAVVRIARQGVVPSPWRLAPLWALCTVAVTQAIAMLLVSIPGLDAGAVVGVVAGLSVIRSAAIVFLGIVAIVLGALADPRAVTLLSSRE